MAEKRMRASRKVSDSTAEIPALEGRMPPYSAEFEEAVLGAILLEQDAYGRVAQILKPSSFYVKAHEQIYTAMTSLALTQTNIDILSVSDELRRMGLLTNVGGQVYISGLTLKTFSSASIEYHAQRVAEMAKSRRLITFATEVLRDAYDDIVGVEDQMQRAEGQLFELAQEDMSGDFHDMSSLLSETMHEIQAAANNQDGLSGVPTGFPGIDAMTAGWQNSDLIIIAARPAMGKTAFVVSMAKSMAIDFKIPVALFNLEMSGVQLAKRFLSNVSEISGDQIKNGKLGEDGWKRLLPAVERLNESPLFINDNPSLSVFELRSKARRLVREHGVRIIIIDYLQLMNASGMNYGNREQEVSMISRSLKMLAKELKIPIIALSQLNRGVENRQGDPNSKRPQLSDLRESGAIEQDADMVCFIHRPEYYKIYEDPATGASLKGVGEFIIAKHRNGAVGDVRLAFRSEFAKFLPLDSDPLSFIGPNKTQDGKRMLRRFDSGGGSSEGVDPLEGRNISQAGSADGIDALI